MVCKVCQDMLYGHKGRIGSGSQLQLEFWHHKQPEHVKSSAERSGCYLCRVIYRGLQNKNPRSLERGNAQGNGRYLSASLRAVPGWDGVYRLNFKANGLREVVAGFILKQIDDDESLSSRPARPISPNTNDPKVFALAREWISECEKHEKCRSADGSTWYPTRLLDLNLVTDSRGAMTRLVSRRQSEHIADQPAFDGRYATLSHRWGEVKFRRLTQETLNDLQTGMLVKDLPRTFRDAITFAREIGANWLWIDAMCIIQKDDEDWLYESSQMEKVYSNSYCNISATAALDSTQGLFYDRNMSQSWVEYVTLKTQDLKEGGQDKVSCAVLDLSFWHEYVENAPVNRRSWVFQERLLSPRVIHWCHDQIVFECRELDRAECRPHGLPHFQMQGQVLINGTRLKGIDLEVGKQLLSSRSIRRTSSSGSQDLENTIVNIESKFYYYEIWKRMVETYTKMELAESRDRLIALSGVARMIASTLEAKGTQDQYIAGMWKNCLASQLLWHVNEGTTGKRQPFEDTRPPSYRAPSFSWASVETMRGVAFAETTEKGLLIRVELVRLIYRTQDDMYGLLKDGYLILRGFMRKIMLTNTPTPPGHSDDDHNRYSWRLIRKGEPISRQFESVYLDSPASTPSVFGPDAQVYLIPALKTDLHLICLLVQATDGDYGVRYRRIGLAKIQTVYFDVKGIVAPPGSDEADEFGRYYRFSDEKFTGESTICII